MARHDELWIPDVDEKKWPKYLITTGIIVAAVVVIFILIIRLYPSDAEETERGMQMLKEMETVSVSETEAAITQMRQTLSNTQSGGSGDSSLSLQIRVADQDILIMGDSLAANLLEYGTLDSNSAIGSPRASVADYSGLMQLVYNAEPWNFVTCYGTDDIVKYGADVDRFIADYEALLKEYDAMRPSSEMYVCGIPGVSSEAAASNRNYLYTSMYNEAIRRLCKKMRIKYIDTEDLVTEYASDGLHPDYSFYEKWVARVLSAVTGLEVEIGTDDYMDDMPEEQTEESASGPVPASAAGITVPDETQSEDSQEYYYDDSYDEESYDEEYYDEEYSDEEYYDEEYYDEEYSDEEYYDEEYYDEEY